MTITWISFYIVGQNAVSQPCALYSEIVIGSFVCVWHHSYLKVRPGSRGYLSSATARQLPSPVSSMSSAGTAEAGIRDFGAHGFTTDAEKW
jgi:hypothetical protein